MVGVSGRNCGSQWQEWWESVAGMVGVSGRNGGSLWKEWWESVEGMLGVSGRNGGSQWQEWWESVAGLVGASGRNGGSQWQEWWESVAGMVGVSGRNGGSPYHNRSENFNPLDLKDCSYSSCLPKGRIGKILCWQSYEYAVCAKKIIRDMACDKDKYEAAKRLSNELERNRESQRCGYYLNESSKTGFSFDLSRSELLPCYEFYDYHQPDTRYCQFYLDCLGSEEGIDCWDMLEPLACIELSIRQEYCRKYIGRDVLKWYRIYQDRGDFDRCKYGISPEDDMARRWIENKHHMWCYNLSNNMGVAFSVKGQQSAFHKGSSWIVLVAVLVITCYSTG
ncbi:uncharacterized protein LOC131953756 [Physella acuta]|uniref:uncharacterized protein LOC131953756 n=1 Tax=Physella acuta TaxID=109671 RepID=UPI0027DD33C5|nr:uncharacterized protein LOC131953756 [Physella acuta]